VSAAATAGVAEAAAVLPLPAEMVAPVANMIQSALAAGPLPGRAPAAGREGGGDDESRDEDLPPGTLIPFRPSAPSVPELSALDRTEHKILPGTEVKSTATVALAPVTGAGTFSGYLAAFGRDHGGDTIQKGAMDASAAALNSGAIQWHLTDAHSDLASDVVATVTSAAVDHYGCGSKVRGCPSNVLRPCGKWSATERGSG
jgi:hypothetical protein